MQEVFNFILSHYELIISGLTLIISIVILIIRKKPILDLYSDLFGWCIFGIFDAERSGLKGNAKLLRATNYVLNCLKDKYPGINTEDYRKYVVECIEYILTTPQKKEVI